MCFSSSRLGRRWGGRWVSLQVSAFTTSAMDLGPKLWMKLHLIAVSYVKRAAAGVYVTVIAVMWHNHRVSWNSFTVCWMGRTSGYINLCLSARTSGPAVASLNLLLCLGFFSALQEESALLQMSLGVFYCIICVLIVIIISTLINIFKIMSTLTFKNDLFR